jgi:thiol-disulfide isomerase/thioredoxin
MLLDSGFFVMSLRPAISAALLALFAAACQPADAPAAETATPAATPAETAAPAAPSSLPTFAELPFSRLDYSIDLNAPTSAFVDETGAKHTFAEFKGKVLVYNIWAEWCGPCVLEMPSLARLQKAFAGKDVAVVPVAYGFGKDVTRESTLAKFRELVGTDLPFFFDGDLMLQSEAQTGALPATLIYDKEGREVARLVIPAEWDEAEAIELVQAVLDGKS